MAGPSERWWSQPELWIEGFSILNIGFLTFDIFIAHSVNQFRSRAEYIPLLFSAIAPLFLMIALTLIYAVEQLVGGAGFGRSWVT